MSKLMAQAPAIAAKLAAAAKPKLQVFWRYAKVELTPPTPFEIPQIGRDIANLLGGIKRLKQVTVREAWLNTLVTVEIGCWFYVGECIGKRHIVGYDV